MNWRAWASMRNAEIDAAGRHREPRDFDARGPHGLLGGKSVVSFASNDYLGLSANPLVNDAAREALERWGAGSGSARLIVGSRPVHGTLERELAEWKDADRAVLFPNGYATNLGVLSTFGTEDTLICSDELNHASIVDGCRLSRARVAVYRHNDMRDLHRLLLTSERAIVVTDAVFSMDGDIAPLGELMDLCSRYGALLLIDEAHAVLGPRLPARTAEVIRVGTLSKFVGAFGGFAAGSKEMMDLLVNTARPYIFTTASSPADAAAALAGVELLRSAEGDALRNRLRTLVDKLRPGHPSPIVPFIIGDDAEALAASRRLLERGLFVPAIRPPSGPQGTARLRVTLSAAHTDDQVDALVDALEELGVGAPVG